MFYSFIFNHLPFDPLTLAVTFVHFIFNFYYFVSFTNFILFIFILTFILSFSFLLLLMLQSYLTSFSPFKFPDGHHWTLAHSIRFNWILDENNFFLQIILLFFSTKSCEQKLLENQNQSMILSITNEGSSFHFMHQSFCPFESFILLKEQVKNEVLFIQFSWTLIIEFNGLNSHEESWGPSIMLLVLTSFCFCSFMLLLLWSSLMSDSCYCNAIWLWCQCINVQFNHVVSIDTVNLLLLIIWLVN